jgi:hypothetical protein
MLFEIDLSNAPSTNIISPLSRLESTEIFLKCLLGHNAWFYHCEMKLQFGNYNIPMKSIPVEFSWVHCSFLNLYLTMQLTPIPDLQLQIWYIYRDDENYLHGSWSFPSNTFGSKPHLRDDLHFKESKCVSFGRQVRALSQNFQLFCWWWALIVGKKSVRAKEPLNEARKVWGEAIVDSTTSRNCSSSSFVFNSLNFGLQT